MEQAKVEHAGVGLLVAEQRALDGVLRAVGTAVARYQSRIYVQPRAITHAVMAELVHQGFRVQRTPLGDVEVRWGRVH